MNIPWLGKCDQNALITVKVKVIFESICFCLSWWGDFQGLMSEQRFNRQENELNLRNELQYYQYKTHVQEASLFLTKIIKIIMEQLYQIWNVIQSGITYVLFLVVCPSMWTQISGWLASLYSCSSGVPLWSTSPWNSIP